jgi:hypothetical protein
MTKATKKTYSLLSVAKLSLVQLIGWLESNSSFPRASSIGVPHRHHWVSDIKLLPADLPITHFVGLFCP